MKTIATLLFIITILIPATAISQIEQPLRVEIEMNDEFDGETVFPMGKNGVLLYSNSKKSKDDYYVIRLTKYNTDFKEVSRIDMKMPENLDSYNDYQTGDELYFFFHSNKKGEYKIIHYNIVTEKTEETSGVLAPKTNIEYFKVLGNKAYLGGSLKKETVFTVVDLKTGSKNIINLQTNPENKYSIENVQVLEKGKEVHIALRSCLKKECEYQLVRLNEQGEKSGNSITINQGIEKNITSASSTKLSDGSLLITGTYSTSSNYSSEGTFITQIVDGKKQYMKYYNFLDYDNFLSYLPEKKQEKIEKKKEKKEAKGKELSYDYYLVTHDIIEMNEQYILIGEAYYPTYRTETYYTTDAKGNMVMQTRTVFDGYQYSHAVVAGFDKGGNKLWDNTFEMWLSIKPYYAKKFITVSTEGDKINLMFATGSQIKSMSFQNGGVANKREINYVTTGDENDDIKSSYVSNIQNWYDNHFISWGFQKIKNKEEKSGDKKRKVFFFNKITYK